VSRAAHLRRPRIHRLWMVYIYYHIHYIYQIDIIPGMCRERHIYVVLVLWIHFYEQCLYHRVPRHAGASYIYSIYRLYTFIYQIHIAFDYTWTMSRRVHIRALRIRRVHLKQQLLIHIIHTHISYVYYI